MLVQELVDTHVASADPDLDLVLFDSHSDFLCAELVGALALPHEHQLKFIAIRVVVDELCNAAIDCIIFDWDVDGYAGFQIDDVVFEVNVL